MTNDERGSRNDAAPDFEAALRELEGIVARLDRDEVDLDEAMALFERGVARLRAANRLLDEARGRVELLISESTGALRSVELDPGDDPAADEAAPGGEAEDARDV